MTAAARMCLPFHKKSHGKQCTVTVYNSDRHAEQQTRRSRTHALHDIFCAVRQNVRQVVPNRPGAEMVISLHAVHPVTELPLVPGTRRGTASFIY